MQPKELFNSIQKKYLGEMAKESGTASAVPERVETKLNSIQRKYLGTQTPSLFPAAPAARPLRMIRSQRMISLSVREDFGELIKHTSN